MSENENERLPWILCGRKIGTATGWDKADTLAIQLYDFEPGEGVVNIPAGSCVTFDFESGKIEQYDNAGSTVISVDLIDAISSAPRAT